MKLPKLKTMHMLLAFVFHNVAAWSPGGFPNQLGRIPLRGWRSWQAVANEVNQTFMEQIMAGLAKKRPLGENGAMVSLADVGYADIGLDGGYFSTSGVNGSCHGPDHHLIINDNFPNLTAMNEKAHSLKLTSSWYLNQDGCKGSREPFVTYSQDSQDAVKYGFDGVKFDSEMGGPMHNITRWALALNATGKPMMIENCLNKHPTYLLSDPVHCPFNFYRSGPDNAPDFLGGLRKVFFWAQPFLNTSVGGVSASRPGCFAYPDMLGIGAPIRGSHTRQQAEARGCSDMTLEEERALFANWAIISSPLVLGLDTRNDTEVEKYWPIIANDRVLAINQAWEGEPGLLVKQSPTTFAGKTNIGTSCKVQSVHQVPHWLVYKKKINRTSVAALAINAGTEVTTFNVTLGDIGVPPTPAHGLTVQDVWTGKFLHQNETSAGSWVVKDLPGHDSRFVIFHFG